MELRLIILLVIVVVIVVFGILHLQRPGPEAQPGRRGRTSQIDVQLKRRHDLIPNLVNAVKGYMGFEQDVLTQVTEARANAVAAGCPGHRRPGRRRRTP